MAKITSKVQSLGYIVMDDCSGNILAKNYENNISIKCQRNLWNSKVII
jgi:hypothetical protein